jgi:glycogen operon protein
MTEDDWSRGDAHALGVFLNGQEIPTHDSDGKPIRGSSFLIFFNAFWEPIEFCIPDRLGAAWELVVCTADDANEGSQHEPGSTFSVRDRSVVVLRRERTVAGAEEEIGTTDVSDGADRHVEL